MVDGLFFCATVTGCGGGHTPFLQAGAETSVTGVEAGKSDPGSSWEGHSGGWVPVSRMKMRSLVGLSTLRIPLVICPLRRTYVVVAR